MKQCDGCRAGKPLMKLVNGGFVEAADGTMHIMDEHKPGWLGLMLCEQARFCTCDQRPRNLNQACPCCHMRQGEKCFTSNLHPKAGLTPGPDSDKVSP
jgi:hypothetical protein